VLLNVLILLFLCVFITFQALSEEDQSMIPRLAHLNDKLEKKDKIIFKLKKENDSLKVSKVNSCSSFHIKCQFLKCFTDIMM